MSRKPELVAAVEQSSSSKRPSLTDGKVSPLVFASLKQKCESYFRAKDIADEKLISNILDCFSQHTRASVYIENNREALLALEKDDVWKKLRTRVLDERWALELTDDITRTRYDSFGSFSDFSDHMLRCSRLLVDTEYAIDDVRLILIAQAALPDFLRERSHRLSTTDYDEWCTGMIEAVREIANIEAMVKRSRAPSDGDAAYRPLKRAQPANATNSNRSSGTAMTTSAPARSGIAPKGGWAPALTESERALLNQHCGCTRC